MICPFCLERRSVKQRNKAFICSNCREEIHSEYVKYVRFSGIPYVIIGAVGFRGHGKTVFFHSHFYALKETIAKEYWDRVYFQALDKTSLVKLWEGIDNLSDGILPEATPAIFTKPTILRFSGLPNFGDRIFIFYDTSGEVFADPDSIPKNARFLARSPVVLFLVSITDLIKENPGESWQNGLSRLLNSYVLGVSHSKLGGNPKKQHLVVVLTKGDELMNMVGPGISSYLETGEIENYQVDLDWYVANMEIVSEQIRNWLRDEKCAFFLNYADDTFKSVNFSIVSSLGAKPVADGPVTRIMPEDPKRIFDPVLWMLKLQPEQRKWWSWLFRWSS